MTLSELIVNLQKIQKEQGDLDVWYKTHEEEKKLVIEIRRIY